jgi:thymidylate synthase (FAD)
MRPITAKELLEFDKNLQVVVLQCYPIPEQVVYQAGKCDYSETPIHIQTIPSPQKCGEWIVERLLSNEKGHWGPLEHPAITFSVSGYVHSVMAQARTHRVGISFDVQSQRYTGQRVVKVASGELNPEDVFYVRPPGFYVNRTGKKYDWFQEDYEEELKFIVEGCKRYAVKYEKGMCEEHIRDYLTQAIRQNFVVSFNLRSVLHFIDLRAKLDAQLEIQALCEQTIPYLQNWAPNVWKYYEEKRLRKAKLSP